MLENITDIDLKILNLFTRDYAKSYTIREMTILLKINYSHAFNRINNMINHSILLKNKIGCSNEIKININNIETIKLLSYIDESNKVKNPSLNIIIRELVEVDPFICVGLFGSRVSKKATKDSDWDIFIISTKRKEIEKVLNKFSYLKDLEFQVFDAQEFTDSLLTSEETVVKHIVRNKQILYNAHPFYNIITKWERIKDVKTSS